MGSRDDLVASPETLNRRFYDLVADLPDPAWPVEAQAEEYKNPDLAKLRLLTEPAHFLRHMDEQDDVPSDVFEAVAQNRRTTAGEIAMPYLVSETEHEVVYRITPEGRRERLIMWLGRTATEVTLSGFQYHHSIPAYRRDEIEVAEADRDQRELRPGIAHSMVSPRMTEHDAPAHIAKSEHLHAEDAIRVSTAITNDAGDMVGRRMRSVLVRDIPFDAWVKLFKDPANIFGKAFDLCDEHSALSVMELFSQLDLPESALPEGPVTLVEAVLPYITDPAAWRSVRYQLNRFRGNQEEYKHESEQAGRDWAMFDLELARSIKHREATDPVRFFMMQLSGKWSEDSLRIINAHQLGDTQYAMTEDLAALLARAKQKLVGDELSVVTANDAAIKAVPEAAQHEIRLNHQVLVEARAVGANPEYIRRLEARQFNLLNQHSIDSGGGCPGDTANAFGGPRRNGDGGVGEADNPFGMTKGRESWTWKQGVCQVKTCPSPKPTDVGPCNVCRRCQREFDAGRDPTKVWFVSSSSQGRDKKPLTWEQAFGIKPKPLKAALGKRALVGSRN